jgi:hypothetical protein
MFNKLIIAALLATYLITTIALPASASHNPFSQDGHLSISDAYVQETLDELELFLPANDALWNDANFQLFLENYILAIKADNDGKTYQAIYFALKIHLYAQHITDTRFIEAFKIYALTQEETNIISEIVIFIEKNWESFLADPQLIWENAVSGFYDDYVEKEDYGYPNQKTKPFSYSYIDGLSSTWPSDAVQPGHIAYLKVYSNNTRNLKANWEQTKGPDVTFVNTDSKTDKGFISPIVTTPTDLEFTVRYGTVEWSKKEVITVTVQPALDEIQQIYWNYLRREADPSGHAYWKAEYQNGMSLIAIQNEFEQSDEYKRKWKR